MDVRFDCYVEGDIGLVKYRKVEMKDVQETFQKEGFEGRYRDIPQRDLPPSDRKEKTGQAPRFIEKLEDKTVSVGGLVRFTVKVEASPAADIKFYKDGKEITSGGKDIHH